MGSPGLSSAAPLTSDTAAHRPGPHFPSQANSTDFTSQETRGAPTWESLDHGRLIICGRFARIFRAHGLTSCRQLLDYDGGVVARRVGSRETRQFILNEPSGPVHFFLKRHGRPAWRDRILPWLQGGRPIHGARNEWEAILAFHDAGIPTMTPVAFGELGADSLLVTEALPARCNLLELIGGRTTGTSIAMQTSSIPARLEDPEKYRTDAKQGSDFIPTLRGLTERVAAIARTMHAAGFHHQDFYLNHLLLCERDGDPDVRVIDLGRVRRQFPLSHRWTVKDLAQLNFSAERLSTRARLRFLRLYLDRPFQPADRRLVRRIAAKSRRIAAHTRKHSL